MKDNYSGEVAHFRDTFLSSEKDYIKDLIKVPEFLELYKRLTDMPSSILATRLGQLFQLMESGEITYEDASEVEIEMILCCLAIEDAIKTKGPLVKSMDNNNGRSR